MFVKVVNISVKRYNIIHLPYDEFRSDICHLLKSMGDQEFVKIVYREKWIYLCILDKKDVFAIYLLCMCDYLSRIHGQPYNEEYEILRQKKLPEPLYTRDLYLLKKIDETLCKETMRKQEKNAYPEFKRNNIMEGGIRDVV